MSPPILAAWEVMPVLAIELSDEVIDALAERVAAILEERAEGRRWAEIEATAAHLGCSVRRVRDLRERGLPARRIGKRLLFDLREVDAWLERKGF